MSIFKKVFAVLTAWSQEKTEARQQQYQGEQREFSDLAKQRAASQQEAARKRLEEQMEAERLQREVPQKEDDNHEAVA